MRRMKRKRWMVHKSSTKGGEERDKRVYVSVGAMG